MEWTSEVAFIIPFRGAKAAPSRTRPFSLALLLAGRGGDLPGMRSVGRVTEA
jgi:hypothetical protein